MDKLNIVRTLACAAIGLTLCIGSAQAAAPQNVVIADQFGPGHLVTLVMKERGMLARRFPSTTFEWRVITSGGLIRDGMLSDRIQIGLYAPPPFLLGLDKGVKWKIVAGAATYDQWLVSRDSKIRSARDLTSDNRKQIAVVGLDSFPAIVVKKLSQREFGDPKALDSQLVMMPPPQAIQAILTEQLAGAVLPPPFMVLAVDGGAHIVERRVFSGPVTNNFYVMMTSFHDRYPEFAKGFYDAVGEAVRFIRERPDEAFQLLAKEEGGKKSVEMYRDLTNRAGTEFGTTPHRILEVGQFMKEIGLIKAAPHAIQDISFPSLGGKGN